MEKCQYKNITQSRTKAPTCRGYKGQTFVLLTHFFGVLLAAVAQSSCGVATEFANRVHSAFTDSWLKISH